MNLYNDRYIAINTDYAVERSKLVNWGEGFLRDVEHVKNLHRQNNACTDMLGNEECETSVQSFTYDDEFLF